MESGVCHWNDSKKENIWKNCEKHKDSKNYLIVKMVPDEFSISWLCQLLLEDTHAKRVMKVKSILQNHLKYYCLTGQKAGWTINW